jgi:homoserine kinase
MENGALSFGISGSGPSVFTFTKNEDDARRINEKLQKHFLWLDTESIAYQSPINAQGPIILD